MFSFGWKDNPLELNINTSEQVLDSIKEEICKEGRVYSHVYKPGDFIISDNLAVGHEADPATQLPREEVKLATYPPDYFLAKFVFQIVHIDNPTRLGWEWCTAWQLLVHSLLGNRRKAEVTDEVQISGKVSFSREYFRFESPSISDFQNFSWMK